MIGIKKIKEKLGFLLLRLSIGFVVLFLIVILTYILVNGARVLSWEFLTQSPKNAMTEGGIFPALVGTFLVTLITAVFSVPLGIFAAIYLNEYAPKGKLNRLIKLSIRNLSGVPSIIYGLFGVALFVQILKFGGSLLSSGLTLGLLSLPWIITASEEALKSVPNSYREGAFALGASKWQTFWRVTLPSIKWGLVYGITLTIARSIGEFGAVLVVSGSIINKTQTATLHIHQQFTDFNYSGAFSAAVVLALLSFTILIVMKCLYKKKEA